MVGGDSAAGCLDPGQDESRGVGHDLRLAGDDGQSAVLSRAGVASGVDGVFIETHPEPEKALCDAASQLCVYDLEEFLKPLIELHNVVRKY